MRILLVDDDPSCRVATKMLLEHLGCSVVAVADAEQALARFERVAPDAVFTDHLLPGWSGRELAAELKRRQPTIPVVMCTALDGPGPEAVDVLLSKPASMEDFQSTLTRLGASVSRHRPLGS